MQSCLQWPTSGKPAAASMRWGKHKHNSGGWSLVSVGTAQHVWIWPTESAQEGAFATSCIWSRSQESYDGSCMDAGARSESSGCLVKWEAPHCQRKTRPGTGALFKCRNAWEKLAPYCTGRHLCSRAACVCRDFWWCRLSGFAYIGPFCCIAGRWALYSCSWPCITKKGSGWVEVTDSR